MRRFSDDDRREHQNFLGLDSSQRLFVQRWVELFDRNVPFLLRGRPTASSQLADEREAHANGRARDFQTDIIDDEIAARNIAPDLSEFDVLTVAANPQEAAVTLAEAVSGLGFSPEFAFQAYRAMLYPPELAFEDRLRRLITWWVSNRQPRPITVAYRVVRNGRRPLESQVVGFEELAPRLQRRVNLTRSLTSTLTPGWQSDEHFLTLTVSALDPNKAASVAQELVERFAESLQRGRGRPIEVDLRWHLVDDYAQVPDAKAYAFTASAYRYPMPKQLADLGAAARLQEASEQDEALGRLAPLYFRALNELREGRVSSATHYAFSVYEQCFGDYVRRDSESSWGSARLFVDKASLLLALRVPMELFHHLYRYCVQTSYHVGGGSLGGSELRPERIYDLVEDQTSFETLMGATPWDELLRARRNQLLDLYTDYGTALATERRVLRWDLARAVRLRNQLFHRGQPLTDQHFLAVILSALEQVIDLRVACFEVGVPFQVCIERAESDFAAWVEGASAPPTRSNAANGWRGQRSPVRLFDLAVD